ncbi:MAG: hypothetical protein ACE5JA_07750 [bacterium]
MTRLLVGYWSAAVLLFAGGCGHGRFQVQPWRVGQWVRYDVTSHDRKWELEYAVVGKERNGNSQLFWLEARRFDEADSLFLKWLVPRGLEGPAAKVLIGERGAPAGLVVEGACLTEKLGKENGCNAPRYLAMETVETPAGRFSSKKFKHPAGLVWLSPKVPVFGIVRLNRGEEELVLVAYGLRGATSELIEASGTAAIP